MPSQRPIRAVVRGVVQRRGERVLAQRAAAQRVRGRRERAGQRRAHGGHRRHGRRGRPGRPLRIPDACRPRRRAPGRLPWASYAGVTDSPGPAQRAGPAGAVDRHRRADRGPHRLAALGGSAAATTGGGPDRTPRRRSRRADPATSPAGCRGGRGPRSAGCWLLAAVLGAAFAAGPPNDARWLLLGLLAAAWLVFPAAVRLVLRVPARTRGAARSSPAACCCSWSAIGVAAAQHRRLPPLRLGRAGAGVGHRPVPACPRRTRPSPRCATTGCSRRSAGTASRLHDDEPPAVADDLPAGRAGVLPRRAPAVAAGPGGNRGSSPPR